MAGGMHGSWCGHAWWGGMHDRGMHGRGACLAKEHFGGACMVGSMHGGEHAWRGACMAGETATAADGMHPTVMLSCYL